MLSEAQIDDVAAKLDARFGLSALYLYGSEAQGRARDDSDVDLAVLVRRSPSAFERLEACSELVAVVGRDVDLVVLDEVSPILAMQVLRTGRCLVDRFPAHTAEVEARLFSQYADLKRVRAEAEKAVIDRVRRG